jgi:hypothetical protein
MHRKVFYAIHTERNRLDKTDDILAFMTKNGIEGPKFLDAYTPSTAGQGQGARPSWARPTRSTAFRRSACRGASTPRAAWPARRMHR